ncbi:hypothetical protein EJ04DRAFT_367669 [Polyplosphaeria fusca]|uniref:Uncharacterized protein n=1 Tax=Polyplosphaeria fusca TaxID=682080 RepID=A0A9P4QV61_9PLEO|nr:hypothetical protein EJ04DRAFT_367669 [Polyplosphaeria fusca]
MSKPRLIDAIPTAPRKVPMRVLALGLPNTGQISLALRKLGYDPFSMPRVLSTPSLIPLCQEAVDLTLLHKSPTKPPYTRSDFDKLLGDHDAVAQLPTCMFARELVDAYPDAQVILTTVPYDEWERGMRDGIWCLLTWRLFVVFRVLGLSKTAPLMRLVHALFAFHNGNAYGGAEAQVAYRKHNDMVRDLVPVDRFLEMGPEDGWEKLCAFLGKEVPKAEFPRVDEAKGMRAGLERTWWAMLRYMVEMILLPGVVCVLTLLWWWGQDEAWAWVDREVFGRLRPLAKF